MHARLKKQKQVEVIRFKADEGCLPLTTRYISGDGCVSYVTCNYGTSVTLGDAYEGHTRVYGMRQISVNGGPRVECATDSLSTGAICYRADNGAIAPLWRLPDTAAMKAYRTIFRQCWTDNKTALPHCCDACKEHVVFALERGKWKDVVLKCPNESCNKQYKITKFDGTNVGCYDISDVQAEVSSSVTNGSSSSSIVTTTTSPVESKDNEDIVQMEVGEAVKILAKQTKEALQKSKAKAMQDLTKYVKKGKEEHVFDHLVQAQLHSGNMKKRKFHVMKTIDFWTSDDSCAEYMKRYTTEAPIHDIYVQHALQVEREEKGRVLTLDEDGNVKSITRKQMFNEVRSTFGALDSKYSGSLVLRK